MTTGQLAIILIRLAAVLIVAATFRYAGSFPSYYWLDLAQEPRRFAALVTLVHVAPLILALVLWVFPAHVARNITADAKPAVADAANLTRLFPLGIALIGVYVCAYGILDLSYYSGA